MANMKYATLWISAICVIVFIIQMLVPGFTDNFMLTSNAISMPWQFVTAIFLHGGLSHIVYNLFALILFGLILESILGSKKFIFIFLASGIIANLISFSFYPSSLGASGAIMGILGTLAVLRPGMTVWAFNLPMPMFIAAIIWAGGSVLGIFGIGDPTVGHWAHLSGIVVGIAYGFYLRMRYGSMKETEAAFERKVYINEPVMRSWEDSNLR